MKLQKQLSRKVGTTEYAKWVIVLPSEYVKELGWKEGQEMRVNADKKRLIIEKKD
jgi:bifunctional DNA-binding transcriptional regulator/antitoxin component of YhaV-PrlF toxin-antitoxin module